MQKVSNLYENVCSKRFWLEITGIIGFSLLMALSAQIKIPLFFTPVPVTFQNLVLLLSLVILKRKAVFSHLLYIVLGIGGVPLFSNGGGLFYLLGPTGGYLLGFVCAAWAFPYVYARFLKNQVSFLKLIVVFAAINVLFVYGFGLTWLHYGLGFSLKQGLTLGVYPFLMGDAVKIVVAAGIAVKLLKHK
jgi:biotin transport system substrate-specific component